MKTIKVKECCRVCSYGMAINPSTIRCNRVKSSDPKDYSRDPDERCRHFSLIEEMEVEKND